MTEEQKAYERGFRDGFRAAREATEAERPSPFRHIDEPLYPLIPRPWWPWPSPYLVEPLRVTCTGDGLETPDGWSLLSRDNALSL